MGDILFQYHKVNPTTWVYLSSLLTIGLYFKFSRLWSVRNLDLIGLILLAPGLLAVDYGVSQSSPTVEQVGYVWLFSMSAIFVVRLLLDPMMVRRPLLEPNLSVGGMTFIGTSLLIFLMANVINSKPTLDDRIPNSTAAQSDTLDRAIDGVVSADAANAPDVLASNGNEATAADIDAARRHGSPLLNLLNLPPFVAHWILAPDASQESRNLVYRSTVRTMAILSHVAVVLGMVVIGYRHFDNIKTGIAAAMLYLLLPYTAQMTGRVDHVLTAALLVWAIEAYRRPAVAGVIMGLAIGVTYYPVFLLPLWLGFYWQRGLVRFIAGVASMIFLVLLSLLLTSNGIGDFWLNIKDIFGWSSQAAEGLTPFSGFWGFAFIDSVYRIPVLAAFFALCGSLALWPAQKNLGTLLSCSAAVMLATQFWHPRGGGLFMAWYLPLLLLTIFRPNLEDRVALSVLGEGWFPKRKANLGGADLAA
jgi:hypothetical protein